MTVATSSPSNQQRSAMRGQRVKLVQYLITGAVALAIAGGLYWSSPKWMPLIGLGEETVVEPTIEKPNEEPPTEVTLPPEKLAAANIQLGTARQQAITDTRTVPGKLEYNSRQRLELKAPAAGVVKQVLVEAGQQLAAGDRLLVLTSPEIGVARDEVLAHTSDLELAQQELTFHSEIATNVGELLTYLATQPKIAEVEAQFADRLLGDYRDRIVSAYSKLKLAQAVANSTAGLTDQGVISGRLAEERASAREVAAAAFQAACEQARFQSRQARDKATANVAHCERLLTISQQSLQAMLGPFAVQMNKTDADLSEFTLCAPFAATVQERLVASNERVSLAEPLYVLADTQQLCLAAEIHERDWQLLNVLPGQTLEAHSPAFPNETFTATVKRIGPSVSLETRSVSLLAEIKNPTGLFKPGMFMWVTVPQAEQRPGTVIPMEAVVRHDEQPFVFVPHAENNFHRVNVKLGQEGPGWVEVVDGLKPDDQVVTTGAFFLKSELLLEREAE